MPIISQKRVRQNLSWFSLLIKKNNAQPNVHPHPHRSSLCFSDLDRGLSPQRPTTVRSHCNCSYKLPYNLIYLFIPFLALNRGRAWQPTPVCLPGESHGQRSLVGYCPWNHKGSDTIERLTHLL